MNSMNPLSSHLRDSRIPQYCISHFINEEHSNKHSRLPHIHDDFLELFFVYSGKGRYMVDSQSYDIQEGDIISLDAGLIYEGYHSDAARTYGVGEISKEAQKLIDVTRESFFEGIKYAKAGHHLHEISAAIGAYAEKFGYGVVRDLVGHGIGTSLHEDPQIPNFAQRRRGIRLQPGMTLAIEPMINMGRADVCWLDDDWTVVTEDGMLSAHYENTVLITEGEPELLTLTK